MILNQLMSTQDKVAQLETILAARGAPDREIEQQLSAYRRGDRGERYTAMVLNRVFATSERYAVLHDLMFDDAAGGIVQIDHLVLHSICRRAIIVETKNFGGNLTCNERGEWTVFYGRKAVPIPSPVLQAKRAAGCLERLLKSLGFAKLLPQVEYLVAIDPRARLGRVPDDHAAHVVKSDQLPDKITEGISTGRVFKWLFVDPGLPDHSIVRIGNALIQAQKRKPNAKDSPLEGVSAQPPQVEQCQDAPSDDRRIDGLPRLSCRRLPQGQLAIVFPKTSNLDWKEIHQLIGALGRWNGRYSNWVVPTEGEAAVERALIGRFQLALPVKEG